MIRVATNLINQYQTGFIHGRYIADNRILVRLIMDHASRTRNPSIALTIDQLKAYDRIHPEYLQQVLSHYGFPSSLINCIISLFFNTQISVNVNGHISPSIVQKRGVRQGDPLSPLLFNLALEPFLQRFLLEQEFQGYSIPSSFLCLLGSPAAKILAYADDTLVFIQNRANLDRCFSHLSTHSATSNAKINTSKTQVISLSGAASSSWLSHLEAYNISSWHDCNSSEAMVYLGYPLYSSGAISIPPETCPLEAVPLYLMFCCSPLYGMFYA
ncbi:hypothetical protein INT45_001866 [Circinella minor]|uniref:Reverse transcriptase domain-containing protein n=1 Tax=Circinella minor TaxID=1195481 RepID=A0A8H7RZ51_9FUNG|nr:hypothetical protein INT45_001866 [Circinella minor]